MSSGACRALAAVLLTLIACVAAVLPVAANSQNLNERSTVTYRVDPANGTISVDIVIVLRNGSNSANPPDTWGPIVVEERATPSVPGAFRIDRFEDLPGLWKAMYVDIPRIGAGDNVNLRVRYTLDASIDQGDARKAETPARVDEAYIYACVPGQDTDSGKVAFEVANASRWALSQSGTVLQPTADGLESDNVRSPREIFTCVEGTRDGRLATDSFIGPADRQILLQAWPSEAEWLFAAESNAAPALDAIARFLGMDIPSEGPVIIRQAPVRALGGYASAHDTAGIVQLDERGGVVDPEHELAHAWFTTDNFSELWLREGMAAWTATAMVGAACEPVQSNAMGLDLADWQVVRPISDPATIDDTIAAQEDAACGIVGAMAARMGYAHWQNVLTSLLKGETKYIGSAGPAAASTTRVDYREWLDAVDERGLVPAAKAAADFPGDVASLDLDFAQDLLDEFGIPADALELERRSTARAYYHQFLLDAAPLGAPLAVREAMDNWEFERATAALDKAYEVLNALHEADEKLPTAGLIPFVQPAFESARNAGALDEVLATTMTLLDSATEVFEPLGELQAATPEGWSLPAAIRQAIAEQRFDDIVGAIAPALAVVREVSAAADALPTSGLLEKYRARYEATATTSGLEELATAAATDRRDAERAGVALEQLRNEVGDWRIPAAATDPIVQGQLAAGLAIINDARAVVNAAREADAALREANLSEEIRPRFEAVERGADMAALRAEAESRRDEAVAVDALQRSLTAAAPTWQQPVVVREAIEARDFAKASLTATAAREWVEKAHAADQNLPQMRALERIKDAFEGARTIEQLNAGKERADKSAQAASSVANAIAVVERPRDLLAEIGLMGTDVTPIVDAALEAAIAGEVDVALQKSRDVTSIITSGGSSGSLRVAGIVFLAIAILGVLGLWVMLRREAGPPWARQSRPHWVDGGESRWRRSKKG